MDCFYQPEDVPEKGHHVIILHRDVSSPHCQGDASHKKLIWAARPHRRGVIKILNWKGLHYSVLEVRFDDFLPRLEGEKSSRNVMFERIRPTYTSFLFLCGSRWVQKVLIAVTWEVLWLLRKYGSVLFSWCCAWRQAGCPAFVWWRPLLLSWP